MSESLSRILLWLFVINLGIAFGAGLYEGRIVVPRWLIAFPDATLHWNAEAAQRDDTGLRFWVFVTTVPLSLHWQSIAHPHVVSNLTLVQISDS